jgi:hypothetical protein
MRTKHIAAIALVIGTTSAALVRGQEPKVGVTPVQAQEPKRLQGFSLLLLLGDTQGAAQPANISAPARKALADIKDFLPYKNYRILDTQWVAGSDDGSSSGSLRGLDNENYQFTLRTFGRTPQPGVSDTSLGRAQLRVWTGTTPNVTFLLDNSFNITTGETVVVGTSRVQGDRALVVLLTAVAAGK